MKTNLRQQGLLALLSILLCCGIASCSKEDLQLNKKDRSLSAANALAVDFNTTLAYRWAPVHYQDVDQTGTYALGGKSDYITNVNFDNDWIATNNWNNQGSRTAPAHVYYSVVETSTHWYITYAFYHARDWTDNPFGYQLDQHENDVEGYLSIIRKDGSTYGVLDGIVTVAHSDFFSFTPQGSPLQGNQENIDGTLSMETYDNAAHPVTAQEAKGHGLKAWPAYQIVGDGIKYFPSPDFVAGVPVNADDRNVKYKLVNIFEPGGLWEQRNNTQLFYNAGGGFISSVGNGNANAPWAWNDGNDGAVEGGEIATDPAKLVNVYFKNLGSFSTVYLSNKYKGIN